MFAPPKPWLWPDNPSIPPANGRSPISEVPPEILAMILDIAGKPSVMAMRPQSKFIQEAADRFNPVLANDAANHYLRGNVPVTSPRFRAWMGNVTELDLKSRSISDDLPCSTYSDINELLTLTPRLKRLTLRQDSANGRKFTRTDFNLVPSLECLRIVGCPIEASAVATMRTGLQKLKQLVVVLFYASGEATPELLSSIRFLVSLERFEICDTQYGTLKDRIHALRLPERLQSLCIQADRLGAATLAALPLDDCPALSELELRATVPAVVASLANTADLISLPLRLVPHLRRLSFRKNNLSGEITGVGPVALLNHLLPQVPNVEDVDLGNCGITPADLHGVKWPASVKTVFAGLGFAR